jgi:transcription elongation factor SPT6
LDDTRIHPEDYELARKMAADALDIDEHDEENPSQMVQELMEGDVDRLNLLMLDDYAVELERQIHEPKRICLNEIKEEIISPYKDKRQRFEPATVDEVFTMLTGESSDTLKEGVITSASIVKALPNQMLCKLPSGIDGNIRLEELEIPFGDEEYAARHFPVYTVLQCVVLKVDKEKIYVDLSARQDKLDRAQVFQQKDAFFSNEKEMSDLAEVADKKKLVKERHSRVIPHPFFHDMNFTQAETYLAGESIGSVVVRPSTKGCNHISITWKVLEDIYQHIGKLLLMQTCLSFRRTLNGR